ncbi:MAG: hypothetical protein ACE363_16450 [Alphaproteobacteria bacterium]
MTIKNLPAVVLACLLMTGTNLPSKAQERPDSTVGQIVLNNAKKAAGRNASTVCTLAANVVWNKSLHRNDARGIHNRRCHPDRARHIRIDGPVAAGTRLQFFNNRNASTTKPGDSSFAQITILQDIAPGQQLIIGSFEAFQRNPLFYAASYCNMRRDGRRWCPFRDDDYLDGKVSYVRVLPPRTSGLDEFSIDEETVTPNEWPENDPDTDPQS